MAKEDKLVSMSEAIERFVNHGDALFRRFYAILARIPHAVHGDEWLFSGGLGDKFPQVQFRISFLMPCLVGGEGHSFY